MLAGRQVQTGGRPGTCTLRAIHSALCGTSVSWVPILASGLLATTMHAGHTYARPPCATPAAPCCPHHPRYLLGGALNAGAQNLAMLICGRVALGFGVGFANQSVPLFLSEMV